MKSHKALVMGIVCSVSLLCLSEGTKAESILWGKRIQAVPPEMTPHYEGNTITLDKPATITHVEGDAAEYQIWRLDPDAADLAQAYQDYMGAYDAMAKLMAAGKGDTPEGRQAYADFIQAKADYDALLAKSPSSGTNKPAPGDAPGNFDRSLALLCAPDEDFIRSLYHCITHREPTAQELEAQVGRLQSGTLRKDMVQYFFASPGYVNQNHDSVRFITDACQAIYGRQPTEGELAAWPRTWRSNILEKMFKDPAHLAATQNCEAKWRKASSGDPSHAAAYKAYIAAYNGLTTLMAAGKGDTPEAKAAYQKFISAKIAYEKALSGSTPRSPEPGTGNDIPPAADARATSAPAPAAGKTQVPATSARIAAAPVSPVIHQTQLLNSIPPSPWNRENVFSRADTIYMWVESKVLHEPHTLEIVWVDPSGKEIKRETFDLHGWGSGESIWSELKTSQQMMQGQWEISLLTDGREERAVSFILNP